MCFSNLTNKYRLISVEIMIEATERLSDGRETKRLLELFVVSGMGLAVNLVGMACFGHHHHGHDHGDHSHGHSHSDEKAHSHDDDHSHDHKHDCSHDDHDHKHEPKNHSHSPLLPASKPEADHSHSHTDHGHSHGHSHDNENMHGIFLHVLADTMGSAAVMVSTALIYISGWSGWDPIASCIIAILIFLSSIPLIKSTAKKLLLTIPDDVEYNLRTTLSSVSDLRGVASYSVPRFWLGDKNAEAENVGVLGVMHIVATRGSDLDDVRERTRALLRSHGIDVVVQVEKDGDNSCWCGGSASRSPSRF
jgi:zinc transporter 5/7